MGAVIVLYFAIIALQIAGMWAAFQKAGRPGWAAIVPIYNIIVWCEVGGKPGWWVLLCLIPIVSLVIVIILCSATSEAFGKGSGFTIGLFFLGFIFWPILGFGNAQYVGAKPAATY